MAEDVEQWERDLLTELEIVARRATAASGQEMGGPVMVTKAVVVVSYITEEGSTDTAYARVAATWQDLGAAAAMLTAAFTSAWTMRMLEDQGVIHREED